MIQTSDIRFMKRDPQPIELPCEGKELVMLKLQT
jgi:hypothetical protein